MKKYYVECPKCETVIRKTLKDYPSERCMKCKTPFVVENYIFGPHNKVSFLESDKLYITLQRERDAKNKYRTEKQTYLNENNN